MPKSILVSAALLAVALPTCALAQTFAPEHTPITVLVPDPASVAPGAAVEPKTDGAPVYEATPDVIAKIKDEGLNHSQLMPTAAYLTDVIGPRLTASPALKRANEWTLNTMTRWGLQNAHLEAWGPFGRGWTLKNFQAEVVSPTTVPLVAFPLIGFPKAWSPSTPGTLTAEAVYVDAPTVADLAKYEGKLWGKIAFISPPRDLEAEFKPLATRWTDEELSQLAAGATPTPTPTPPTPAPTPVLANTPSNILSPTALLNTQRLNFLKQEGALLVVDNSIRGSGGTVFVAGAGVPQDVPLSPPDTRGRTLLQAYHPQAAGRLLPQMTLATEHYNRLVRLLKQGEKVSLKVGIEAEYQDRDPMVYNTIAEIPGTDLKDEVVMLGAHLDSWHAGTGATDNAAGVSVMMEAARIIQAQGLKPRRTIRVALWTGEEQGLLGSNAYVKEHFADLPTVPEGQKAELSKKADYDNFAAYYNLDNGTGKIRGVYLQSNSAVAPIFRAWLKPFADLGATTLAPGNTGGTDHLAFDRVGLPGFQFIQDRIEYNPRTHHSNQDVYERLQPDDLKQAATIIAAFVYQSAMMPDKLPRKPFVP